MHQNKLHACGENFEKKKSKEYLETFTERVTLLQQHIISHTNTSKS